MSIFDFFRKKGKTEKKEKISEKYFSEMENLENGGYIIRYFSNEKKYTLEKSIVQKESSFLKFTTESNNTPSILKYEISGNAMDKAKLELGYQLSLFLGCYTDADYSESFQMHYADVYEKHFTDGVYNYTSYNESDGIRIERVLVSEKKTSKHFLTKRFILESIMVKAFK